MELGLTRLCIAQSHVESGFVNLISVGLSGDAACKKLQQSRECVLTEFTVVHFLHYTKLGLLISSSLIVVSGQKSSL